MDEYQYLIQCSNPISWSIVYQRSIILESEFPIIGVGMEVTFLWPEDSTKSKPFKGRVLAKSLDELELNREMDKLIEKYSLNSKKNKPDHKIATHDACNQSKQKQRSKKNNDILTNKQILKDLKVDSSHESTDKYSNEHNSWALQKLKLLRLDLDSAYAGLIEVGDRFKEISESLGNIENFLLPVYDENCHSKPNSNNELLSKDYTSTHTQDKQDKQMESVEIKTIKRRSFNMLADDTSEDGHQYMSSRADDDISRDQKIIPEEDWNLPSTSKGTNCRRSYNMLLSTTFDLSDEDIPDKKGLHVSQNIRRSDSKKRSIYVIDSSDDEEPPMVINKTEQANLGPREPEMNQLKRNKIDDTSNQRESHHIIKAKPKMIIENEADFMDKEGLWTLLYTEKDEKLGVVEFIKGSGIFVKGYALKNVQETQLKQTCFARALMKIVFKKDALAMCSLSGRSSGKSTKTNNLTSEDGKPGLYEEGVNAIITYTMAWAKKRGWNPVDKQTIKQSMRQLMVEKRDSTLLNERMKMKKEI